MNILCGVPFWSCVGSQGKQLLALLSVSSYLCVGLNLALVTLRCCFHQDTGIDPLRSGPRTSVVMHLDQLWKQLRFWPDLISMCTCPQSPQLLKSDLFQLLEYLFFQIFCNH